MPTSQLHPKSALAKGSQLTELKPPHTGILQVGCKVSPNGALEFLGSTPADIMTTDLFLCMAVLTWFIWHQAKASQVNSRGKPKR